jgi:phytoene dehydrogenase-like protein
VGNDFTVGTPRDFDVVVVGAGLGGLLAAATAASAGKSVLVLERMPYVGGRFTTVDQDGCQITTGALHLVPHGQGGVLAALMTSIGQPFQGVPRDVIASAFVDGRHVAWRTPLDVLRTFGFRGQADVVRMCAELAIRPTRPGSATFADWVENRTRDATVRQLFERFSQFALSIPADLISYDEMRAVFRNVARHGLPCAPAGGCRALIEQLASGLTARGGNIRTATEVVQVLRDREGGRVRGVRFRDRRSDCDQTVSCRTIVSDTGPDVTARLLGESSTFELEASQPVAAGLKLHVLSDRSLIDHRGIMLCLDTERISGIVQVSNAVPSVAPTGMHMLDTFQVPMTDDFAVERRRAIEDLRYVFGPAFDRHCHVVRTSAFRASWPVNRAIQGQDYRNQEPIPGLLMVGDAYKQPGYMMVEGVASSVRAVADRLRS